MSKNTVLKIKISIVLNLIKKVIKNRITLTTLHPIRNKRIDRWILPCILCGNYDCNLLYTLCCPNSDPKRYFQNPNIFYKTGISECTLTKFLHLHSTCTAPANALALFLLLRLSNLTFYFKYFLEICKKH